MKFKFILILLINFILVPLVYSHTLALQEHAPKRYVVKPGDTLWGIAAKYLKRPWQWKRLWDNNPQISNPHNLYPGMVIKLHRYHGKSYLSAMTPTVNKEYEHNPIPPIPLHLIQPFLNDSLVVDKEALKEAPYIVGFAGGYAAAGAGEHLFAVNVPWKIDQNYSIYRDLGAYIDPDTHEKLGFAAIHLGDARVVQTGDPTTLVISHSLQYIREGDKLLPTPAKPYPLLFYPQEPRVPVHSKIIAFFDGESYVGNDQVIVINQGRVNGLRVGDVLALMHPGDRILDPVTHARRITLPDERIGEAMVFTTFHRVSYALVMRTIKAVRLYDLAENP